MGQARFAADNAIILGEQFQSEGTLPSTDLLAEAYLSYAGYDQATSPFLYGGPMPEKLPAMARVVVVGGQAWELELLRERGRVETDTHVLTWTAGQNSALDARDIAEGRDVGNVVVRRKTADGLEDAVYDVTFAFVFKAFHPDGTWHLRTDG